MSKQYIGYGFVGTLAGLVLGFLIANWTWDAATAAPAPAASGNRPASAPVNTGSQTTGLPPGHPPLDGQPVPAGPLPPGAQGAESAPPASNTAFTELPSLDPLPADSKEKRAEQEYKNIKLLKGVPAERVPEIMNAFKSALGVDCTYCHVLNEFHRDDKAMKQKAREMITLTRNTNAQMAGAGRVTCFTCHRGQPKPPAQ